MQPPFFYDLQHPLATRGPAVWPKRQGDGDDEIGRITVTAMRLISGL